MNTPFKINYCAFIFSLLLFFISSGASCSNRAKPRVANSNNGNNVSNSSKPGELSTAVSDNVDQLMDIIRLPEIPDEVTWKEEPLGEKNASGDRSSEKKLTAVLRYSPENSAKIMALVEKNITADQTEIGGESWFPEELTARLQVSGSESLKGTTYYANEFLNIPYGNGKITRVEGSDYFVLELRTN